MAKVTAQPVTRKSLNEPPFSPKEKAHGLQAEYLALMVALDRIASVEAIYRKAFRKGNLVLCWRIRQDVQDRATGIAFHAINPDKDNKNSDLAVDSRVQIAIQNLIQPPESPQKSPQPQPKQLETNQLSA